MIALVRVRGGGIKQKGLMDNSVVIAGAGIRGINGNGKKFSKK